MFSLLVHASVAAGGVVSLMPSITDMVVELGAGDRLTGVTRYCIIADRPDLTRLGGMYDLNVEALLKLNPDLVLAYRGAERTLAPLENAGIRVRYFGINTLEDILTTYREVGKELGRETEAARQVEQVRDLLQPVTVAPTPRILVVLGEEGLERGPVYVAGRCVYGEIIHHLGAVNPVDSPAAYPSVGREGLLSLKPDLILLITEHKVPDPTATGMLSLINGNGHLSIVNVYGDKAMHPGPALFQLIPEIRDLMERYAADPEADLSGHTRIR